MDQRVDDPNIIGAALAAAYPALSELDPSLDNGAFKEAYNREMPVELRSAVAVDLPSEVGALEAIRVRILEKRDENNVKAVRVELTSESNLFFLYTHDRDETNFKELQDVQRVTVNLPEYPSVLMRMCNNCIREPHVYLAVFMMYPTGEARLDFIQNMDFKFVELLSCKFIAAGEDKVRENATYRYNIVRARLQLLETRLGDVNRMVKIRDPALLMELQRTAPRMPGPPPLGHPKPFYP